MKLAKRKIVNHETIERSIALELIMTSWQGEKMDDAVNDKEKAWETQIIVC